MNAEQKVYIIENRLFKKASSIAKDIGKSTTVVTEYMRIHQIKAPKEIMAKRRSDYMKARWKREKESVIEFAKKLGYNSVLEAQNALGKTEFKKRFRA